MGLGLLVELCLACVRSWIQVPKHKTQKQPLQCKSDVAMRLYSNSYTSSGDAVRLTVLSEATYTIGYLTDVRKMVAVSFLMYIVDVSQEGKGRKIHSIYTVIY